LGKKARIKVANAGGKEERIGKRRALSFPALVVVVDVGRPRGWNLTGDREGGENVATEALTESSYRGGAPILDLFFLLL
jgi:hypothetical protein